MTDALPKPKPAAPEASDGTLLALLMAAFYVIFTLVPGSSTLIVSWPWVFLWQVGLTLPMLWLLWQLWHRPLGRLGSGFDWVALLAVVGLGVSTLGAEFAAQAAKPEREPRALEAGVTGQDDALGRPEGGVDLVHAGIIPRRVDGGGRRRDSLTREEPGAQPVVELRDGLDLPRGLVDVVWQADELDE